MMFKDTLQTDMLFQIQWHNLKNLWSQCFITVPSLEIIALHGVAEKTGREPPPVAVLKPHVASCKQLTLQKGLSFPPLPLLGDFHKKSDDIF